MEAQESSKSSQGDFPGKFYFKNRIGSYLIIKQEEQFLILQVRVQKIKKKLIKAKAYEGVLFKKAHSPNWELFFIWSAGFSVNNMELPRLYHCVCQEIDSGE